MLRWIELGDREFTCTLDDGRKVAVFEATMWRITIDDRMVDDVFFDAKHAIETVEDWQAGRLELSLHAFDRRWDGDDRIGYTRRNSTPPITVSNSACGKWAILNWFEGRCFNSAADARSFADARLPRL